MRAKKSLGQNFLTNTHIVKTIADQTLPEVAVLEVGPGKGVLTRALLERGHRVVAVEKDSRLISLLQEEFAEECANEKLTVIEGDITEIEISSLFQGAPYQIVANLPYYITGLFIRSVLESDYQPEQMVILLQKEVVDRILVQDGKHSLLSLSVHAFGEVSRVVNVPARYFKPKPKIDSAVLKVAAISNKRFIQSALSVEDFFTLLRQAFSSKRKTLYNNLRNAQISTECIEDLFRECNLEPQVRAEELGVDRWFEIATYLSRASK